MDARLVRALEAVIDATEALRRRVAALERHVGLSNPDDVMAAMRAEGDAVREAEALTRQAGSACHQCATLTADARAFIRSVVAVDAKGEPPEDHGIACDPQGTWHDADHYGCEVHPDGRPTAHYADPAVVDPVCSAVVEGFVRAVLRDRPCLYAHHA
ncbi:MAG: hypothetical protein A2V88_12890 [Elusimicrobia bacterium RBG_16_66_12]|nr:MAG: hypothetical protein A2V88_12890 [Elusimicrobia bacterium RBG_16_66_12]